MLFTAHALSSGTAGELIGNPFWAILAGVFIHLLVDSIPHYDTTDGGVFTPRQWALALSDLILGLIIIAILYLKGLVGYPGFFLGILGGILPDIVSLIPKIRSYTEKYKIGKGYQDFHEYIQKIKLKPAWGILIQVAVWVSSILVLVIISK